MRAVAMLATILLVLSGEAARAKEVTLDPATWARVTGTFEEDGATLTVTVMSNNLMLSDGASECSPTHARAKKTRKGIVLSASWPACAGMRGQVRLSVRFTGGDFDDLRGRLRARKVNRQFRATRPKGNAADCAASDTFDLIRRRVFGPSGCRVTTCHGAGAEGGLDLQAGRAYDDLVGAAAANEAAATAGKLRVVPGDAGSSFLVQKLTGALAAGEGEPMPFGRKAISAIELDLVRAWIDAGAPRTGKVADAPCPPLRRYEPSTALDPPAGGLQLVLDGPTLVPGEEVEGCMWVKVPDGPDLAVGSWEYSINPGTHHFAVWEHTGNGDPATDRFVPGDIACIASGARFGISISGAPEAPYFVDAYPRGVGKIVKSGAYLGLNAHYYNEFEEPIQMKVWVNLRPVDGPVEHVADTLLSLTANLNGITPFSINVPPRQQATLKTRFTNTTGAPLSIFQLATHMHHRGLRTKVWKSDGSLFFQNDDWAHPALSLLDPPFVLAPGDFLDYECVHDNGVTRVVRHCGDAPHDTTCVPGAEIPVTFGNSAEDEMCFLTGLFY